MAALFVGGLAFAIGVRYGGYAATITDSSAYVAAGDLWRTGALFRPVPLQLWGHWPVTFQGLSPLGFRPGIAPGMEVVEYPLGMPVLIGAATSLAGPIGAYLVAPVMHMVLVWSVFVLGRHMGNAAAGLLAAVLVAINPIVVMQTIHPMSDVPAAACWLAAWAVARHPTTSAALASGLLTTMAVMVRPNLVLLSAVLGAWWVWRGASLRAWRTWNVRQAAVFGVAAAIGPLLVAWSQWRFYGSVLAAGYQGAEAFFRMAHARTNLAAYPASFLRAFGPGPLAGLAAGLATAVRLVSGPPERRRHVLLGLCMGAVNFAAYLFYLPYEPESYLRFFLVAIAAICILYAVLVAAVAEGLWRRPALRWAAPLLIVAALWPLGRRPDLWAFVADERPFHARVQLMGEYLAAALPRESVALAFFHTGAIGAYAHHNVLRLDLVSPASLDVAVAQLIAGGANPVLVLDEHLEERQYRERYAGTRYGALDWPPRAEFISSARVRYWVASDRDRYLAGERWSTDVLR